MNFLQTPDGDVGLGLLCCYRFHKRFCSGDRRYARDVELESGFTDRLLVVVRGLAKRGVDDHINISLTDQVGDVRTAFVDLEYRLALQTDFTETVRRPIRGDQIETKFIQTTSKNHGLPLIRVVNRDKSLPRKRQAYPRAFHCFAVRLAESRADAHYLAGRMHLGTEYRIDTGKFFEWEDR